MIAKIQRAYALTTQGAKDLVKATLWTVAANLSLMIPVGLLVMALGRAATRPRACGG